MLLPAPLLLLIVSFSGSSVALEFPGLRHGIAASLQSGEHLRSRQELGDLATTPVGVRKMSNDQGEMFFPSYWNFGGEEEALPSPAIGKRRLISSVSEGEDINNGTGFDHASRLQAPLSLHTIQRSAPMPYLLRMPRAIFSLEQRDFQCPTGTSACTGISKPDSCCPTTLSVN